MSLPVGNIPEEKLQQQLEQYGYYWKWFALSLIIFLTAGFMYLRYAERIYYTDATILLQDEKQASGELAGLSELANLAGRTSSSAAFVNDQILIINSRRLMHKVVNRNKLNILYQAKGRVKTKELLESQSPLKLVLQEPNHPRLDSIALQLVVTKKGSSYTIRNEVMGSMRYELGKSIASPIGPIKIIPNLKGDWTGELIITFYPVDIMVNILRKSVVAKPKENLASFAVNISMEAASMEKGKLVVSSLIEQYNHDVTHDKAQVSQATSKFINSRLALITNDLEIADSRLEGFKNSNNIVNLEEEAKLNMQTFSLNEQRLIEYQTQIQIADMLQNSVLGDTYNLLPSNIGLNDFSIQTSVKKYNELVLELEDLLKSATPENLAVKRLTNTLETVSRNLRISLENFRQTLQSHVEGLQEQRNLVANKLNRIPQHERNFKDISRQQQIIENIYLFLLQKREQNEINASATPANLKIIDNAYSYSHPISPKTSYVVLGSVLLAFVIPFSILYTKFLFDKKIHNRNDIEHALSAPILGEIPSSDEPMVQEDLRTSLAEAIRILRTNITYMLGKREKGAAVLYVTSTISGEGKSFIATNLAKIISVSEKKTLLIGADIRSPKVLNYLGLSHLQHTHPGITQFLIDPNMPVRDIVIKTPKPYTFDIIYSGYVAPNPAELLMNSHFEDIISYAREHYDYVIVDTAPVSLVTDTLLISEYADITLYVARANYLERKLLNIPKELYETNKLKNMAVVINDVDFKRGYGYGYGYGYGDTDENGANLNITTKIAVTLKKLFNKK